MTTREYKTDELTVLWDSSRCVHSARCIEAAPDVFDPLARPWVRLDGANTETILNAIERCPTGALRYLRADGSGEPAPVPATIEPIPNGPLLLRGQLRLVSADGQMLDETRLALCRCGGSENKPFCDGTHRRIHFRSDAAPVTAPPVTAQQDPENPIEVGPQAFE